MVYVGLFMGTASLTKLLEQNLSHQNKNQDINFIDKRNKIEVSVQV